MNKFVFPFTVFLCGLTLLACNSPVGEVEKPTGDSVEVLVDTLKQNTPEDTIEKFTSEPGLIKMIRENYLDAMKENQSFLVIPVVSGCNCGLVSFETADSHLTAFRSGSDATTFWLLKGENATYSSKVAERSPKYIELNKPKRSFEEYGLFQSSILIFELRNNSEIVRWVSVDR